MCKYTSSLSWPNLIFIHVTLPLSRIFHPFIWVFSWLPSRSLKNNVAILGCFFALRRTVRSPAALASAGMLETTPEVVLDTSGLQSLSPTSAPMNSFSAWFLRNLGTMSFVLGVLRSAANSRVQKLHLRQRNSESLQRRWEDVYGATYGW